MKAVLLGIAFGLTMPFVGALAGVHVATAPPQCQHCAILGPAVTHPSCPVIVTAQGRICSP